MEGQPHTHDLQIRPRYSYNPDGRWEAKYGQETMQWPRYGPCLTFRRQRKARRIVERHDRKVARKARAEADRASQTKHYDALAKKHARQEAK